MALEDQDVYLSVFSLFKRSEISKLQQQVSALSAQTKKFNEEDLINAALAFGAKHGEGMIQEKLTSAAEKLMELSTEDTAQLEKFVKEYKTHTRVKKTRIWRFENGVWVTWKDDGFNPVSGVVPTNEDAPIVRYKTSRTYKDRKVKKEKFIPTPYDPDVDVIDWLAANHADGDREKLTVLLVHMIDAGYVSEGYQLPNKEKLAAILEVDEKMVLSTYVGLSRRKYIQRIGDISYVSKVVESEFATEA